MEEILVFVFFVGKCQVWLQPVGTYKLYHVFIVRTAICGVSSQICTIGNSDDSELTERTDRRFYLDVNNPATCNGTITNWTVCYYGRSDAASYWATYAIYQKVDSGENERYENVSEMFTAVRTINGDDDATDGSNQIGFNCYTDFIDVGDSPLIIHAGDVIGACVFDPQDGIFVRRELDIVGRVNSDQGESLMRSRGGSTGIGNTCTMDAIPSSIPNDVLEIQDNRRLHIYANIEPGNTNCMEPSSP